MREIWKHQLIVVLVAGLAIFTNLGAPDLWDEDEPKNATCAAEMLARGDGIVPTFNGELRTDKPILLYWCMLPLYGLLGVTELTARLPSALCGIGTALLTYHIGRRLFRPQVGLWAGVLLATSVMFDVASRAATPDGLLIFFSTLAIWFFIDGSTTDESDAAVDKAGKPRIRGLPTQSLNYQLMYGAMAMAVLAKGPVGLVLPTAVIGLYLLVLNLPPNDSVGVKRFLTPFRILWPTRVLRFALAMRPHVAIGMAVCIALPWYIIVGLKTDWDWPAGFLWRHNVQRYMGPMEGHQGPPFYHLLSLAVGFFPASIFLVPMAIHVWRQLTDRQADRRGYILALSWIAVYLVVFSLAGTKLPSYVTPTYPAMALLTGAFVAQWIAQPARVSRGWIFVALGVYGAVGLGIIIALTMLAQRYLPGQRILAVLGLIPLCGAAVCIALWWRGRSRPAATVFGVSATLFVTALFGWGLLRIDRFQEAAQIVRIIQSHSQAEPKVITYRVLRPSWVFYTRQTLTQFATATEPAALVNNQQDTFLVLEERLLPEVQPQLRPGVSVLGRVPRFLRSGHLLVLGKAGAKTHEASPPQTAVRDFKRLR